jgi:CRISPR-associated protein Csb2
MVGLRFELLAGRVHATPWDHHVNEGQVEWPPSPWRVARALIAASWRVPVRDEAAVRSLILRLADTLPVYCLPPATSGHTRHYMPPFSDKVFDAFVAVSGGDDGASFAVCWPGVALTAAERSLLDALAAHVSAIGRAESWALVTVIDALPGPVTAWPESGADDGGDALVLWALQSEADWSAWRDAFKARGGALKDVPATRYDALDVDTGWLGKERWSRPPGVRLVRYAVAGPLVAQPTARPPRHREAPVGTLARYALVGRVLPTVERTIVFGERVRKALLARSDGHPVFLGRDGEGTAKGHQHAFFLPCDDDGDGMIDHVLVWARGGFDDDARRALEAMRSIWAEEGTGEDGRYKTVLLAVGRPEDVGAPEGRHPARLAGVSRVWRSATPFVRFRHTRTRGGVLQDTAADQVRLALSHLGFPAGPDDVRVRPRFAEPEEEAAWTRRFLRTRRDGAGALAGSRGFGFEIEFAAPQRGPIALGYAAHFGLGVFQPSS